MKNLLLLLSVLWVSCAPKRDAPIVTHVFPTSDTIPSNLLRMYVQFSEPMKTVGNLEQIKLMDENGREIRGAIFNNVYELWDDQQTQLTLIFDPARVKTGLQANERLGRALQPDRFYTLIIENLQTIDHKVLPTFTKLFYVIEADTVPPRIQSWTLELPKSGTTESLHISLPEPADWMSINHRIKIADEDGDWVDGIVEVGNHEKEWSFTPSTHWRSGTYFLATGARFADPSGNNLNGLFDHPTGSLRFTSEDQVVKIPFSILDSINFQ